MRIVKKMYRETIDVVTDHKTGAALDTFHLTAYQCEDENTGARSIDFSIPEMRGLSAASIQSALDALRALMRKVELKDIVEYELDITQKDREALRLQNDRLAAALEKSEIKSATLMHALKRKTAFAIKLADHVRAGAAILNLTRKEI